MTGPGIPVIDARPLLAPSGPGRDACDAAIGRACRDSGFLVLAKLPAPFRLEDATRDRLTAVFSLPETEKRRMARRKYNPASPNFYRGFFPLIEGDPSYKESIDIGPDFAPDDPRVAGDPLVEPNPWPDEAVLPGWRAEMTARFDTMERLGLAVLAAMARHLDLADDHFAWHFRPGNSTLRLNHYPPRSVHSANWLGAEGWREDDGRSRPIVTAEHTDSGCVTLLVQDGIGGLQAKTLDGRWIDVPPLDGGIVVNLGDALERWTNGLFQATPHQVLGGRGERVSVPFFFEPNSDAVIEAAPVLVSGAHPAPPPVRYGSYLIEKLQQFGEYHGIGLPPEEGPS
ncbi:MAG: isopenicillin N synthase family oxygenase [Proteobacteria bacterium]|nr:isopenicillin N synthase family oxygenase [Pseudomonadota bacterium]